MTTSLQPPPKKDPLKRTASPMGPPESRSRASLGLTAAAARGKFALQHCARCGSVQYPPRDACQNCLSIELEWQDTDPSGTLLAQTIVRTSTNQYFRDHSPWRIGSVHLDAGPVIICHVHGDAVRNSRVKLLNLLDRAGQATLFAVPMESTQFMSDDPQIRAMTSDPRHRRILITDARHRASPLIASALLGAGASLVFLGESEQWLPNPNRDALSKLPGTEILPLDVTDTRSVQSLAGEIGGKTDILINTARFIRPGGAIERGDTVFARQEMEVNYLGLLRLAQAFGPAMCSRTADGPGSAVAWVNILPVHALSNDPAFGLYNASSAAAYALSQSLRADFRASGLRVTNLFTGPTDDDWHQALPPPKVTAQALAKSIVTGLQNGLEDIACGDVARDVFERFYHSPKVLEKEQTRAGDL